MSILVLVPEFTLSLLEIVYLILSIPIFIGSLIIGLYYLSLDRSAEAYDEQIRENIRQESEFSGIRSAADEKFRVTSNTKISRLVSLIRSKISRTKTPEKFVHMDKDAEEEAQIEVIRERARQIPGRSILRKDFVGALRAHYMHSMALSEEGVNSAVVEHFRDTFELYDEAPKVRTLSKPEKYSEITLLDTNPDEGRDPLNDVFLPLVECAEKYCVDAVDSVNEQQDAIERCRGMLMQSFFILWTGQMKGVELNKSIESDRCKNLYRRDIRDNDNFGYWLISEEYCDEDEFRRLRHIGWRIGDFIDEHWNGADVSKLHPHCDSIPEMEYVPSPFFVYLKDEDRIRGGGPTSNG